MKIWMRGLAVFLFFILTTPVYSYVGPGLGTGALAVIVGVIVSIFLAIFAVLWYPVKRLLGLGKGKAKAEGQDPPQESDPEAGGEDREQ
ncbi:MAG: hypothetical protein R6V67_09765 [Spirochaetia bacterium]